MKQNETGVCMSVCVYRVDEISLKCQKGGGSLLISPNLSNSPQMKGEKQCRDHISRDNGPCHTRALSFKCHVDKLHEILLRNTKASSNAVFLNKYM